MEKQKKLISVDAYKLEELLCDCFNVIKSVKPTQLALMGALQVWIGCCKKQPIVDAVEVVRCKHCDWHRKNEGGICVNPKCTKSWYGCPVPPEHFSSYGERRD